MPSGYSSDGIYRSEWPALQHVPVRNSWSLLLDEIPYSFSPSRENPSQAEGKTNLMALKDGHSQQSYTFRQLKDVTLQVGAGLLEGAGLKRGDVVFTAMIPNISFAVVYLSLQAAGLVIAASNPLYTPSELQHVVGLVKPKAIITTSTFLPAFEKAGLRGSFQFLLADGDPARKETWPELGSSIWALQSLVDYSSATLRRLLAQKGGLFEADAKEGSKLLMDTPNGLFFSSGTSGLPKAVVLTHRNTYEQVKTLLSAPGYMSLPPDLARQEAAKGKPTPTSPSTKQDSSNEEDDFQSALTSLGLASTGEESADRSARSSRDAGAEPNNVQPAVVSAHESQALTLPAFHIGGMLR